MHGSHAWRGETVVSSRVMCKTNTKWWVAGWCVQPTLVKSYKKLSCPCHCKDDVDDTLWRLPSDDEFARRFNVTNSSAIAASSSSSERSELFSYLLYGDRRHPCATYDVNLPQAANTRPRYGGDGFRGRVKYSGWYCTPTKYGWSAQTYALCLKKDWP